MKLAVIGGGGVRSMFLAKSIAQKAAALNIQELVFMDNNEKKLNIYGKMAKVVAQKINPDLRFVLTVSSEDAIRGADYVITTIRVGEDDMRVKDERIALGMGVLGQETTGAAGLSFAMRSVDALADYCELVKQYAKPGCKVFNFTNPAGVVSQTLRDMGFRVTVVPYAEFKGAPVSSSRIRDALENGNVEEGFKEADYIETIEYGRPMWSQFRSMPAAYFSYLVI